MTSHKTRSRSSSEASEDLGSAGAESSESTPRKPRPPRVVADRFRLAEKIGSGSYSDVHLAVDNLSGDGVAVKLEWKRAEKTNKLLSEANFYRDLQHDSGIPKVHWCGSKGEYNIMVLDLLGPSLDSLFKKRKRFSLKTVVMLAKQMIDRLQYVHDCGLLYRDIKPHNFLMGAGEKSSGRVCLVDFGLAKRYRDEKTGEHCKLRIKKGRGVTGTVRYSSINIHEGVDASRRDDLLALGYVLVHFLRGGLPWLGLKAKAKKAKHALIAKKKLETSDEELCAGFPFEFVQYFKYCKSLDFYDRPEYARLQGLFDDIMIREGLENDLRFDWISNDQGQSNSSNHHGHSRSSKDQVERAKGDRGDAKNSNDTETDLIRKRKHARS